MSEIRQASFITDEVEVYIDKEEEDLYLVEVYSGKGGRKLISRNTFVSYEFAFNYVHEEVL